jgi:hypothetical protein
VTSQLRATDGSRGEGDPYVVLTYNGGPAQVTSCVRNNHTSPRWEEQLEVTVADHPDLGEGVGGFEMTVWDMDGAQPNPGGGRDDFLGGLRFGAAASPKTSRSLMGGRAQGTLVVTVEWKRSVAEDGAAESARDETARHRRRLQELEDQHGVDQVAESEAAQAAQAAAEATAEAQARAEAEYDAEAQRRAEAQAARRAVRDRNNQNRRNRLEARRRAAQEAAEAEAAARAEAQAIAEQQRAAEAEAAVAAAAEAAAAAAAEAGEPEPEPPVDVAEALGGEEGVTLMLSDWEPCPPDAMKCGGVLGAGVLDISNATAADAEAIKHAGSVLHAATLERCAQRGRLFLDPAYPAPGGEHSALAGRPSMSGGGPRGDGEESVKFDGMVWLRPRECDGFDPGCQAVFSESAGVQDVHQGALGNCYFVAALSMLAEQPRRIQDLFTGGGVANDAGCYAVSVCKLGQWRVVLLDDRFPTEDGRQPFCKPQSKGGPVGSEMWVALLEKLWAKLHGSYSRIEGGHIKNPMTDFTGAPSHEFTKNKNQLDLKWVWSLLSSADARGYCVGAGIGQVGAAGYRGVACGRVWGRLTSHFKSPSSRARAVDATPHCALRTPRFDCACAVTHTF